VIEKVGSIKFRTLVSGSLEKLPARWIVWAVVWVVEEGLRELEKLRISAWIMGSFKGSGQCSQAVNRQEYIYIYIIRILRDYVL